MTHQENNPKVDIYSKNILRGDIFYADLSPTVGSEQDGFRPVLILQNNKGNKHSSTVIIAPISTKLKNEYMPTHVLINHPALDTKSFVLLEQIRTIDKVRLIEYLGMIDNETLKKVDKGIKISLAVN